MDPISILTWGLIFFLGGFGLYASLMAGAGAMIPRMKETGGANFIAMIPLMVGYLVGLIAPLADETTSAIPVFLSFFPLTSPVVMIMHLTDGTMMIWQLILSAVILFGSAYLVFRAVAAMFHAQHLLSGQPFSIKHSMFAMLGRS